MAIMVHMASVWVPFTSESKEAIADYDEIRKEITLGLREAGRRLGVFIKRRERAHAEHKRRNIFELYIEEVVGRASASRRQDRRGQAARSALDIAKKLTGGQKTDELLDKKAGPHGLPDSIIVTAEGIEGELPVDMPPPAPAEVAAAVAEARRPRRSRSRKRSRRPRRKRRLSPSLNRKPSPRPNRPRSGERNDEKASRSREEAGRAGRPRHHRGAEEEGSLDLDPGALAVERELQPEEGLHRDGLQQATAHLLQRGHGQKFMQTCWSPTP